MSSGIELAGMAAALRALPETADDAVRIDRIRLLEELKSAAAAAQAAETAAFVASQRAGQAVAGVPADRVGRGIAAQVGLARRISPFAAARYTGWATILTAELPGTFAALRAGTVSEWRAMIVARETGWLSREHRLVVDAELAGRLGSWGDRRVEAEANKLGYALDPHGYLKRIGDAAKDRRVTVRPAPEVMGRLSALLPVAQAVAAYAALAKHADTLRGTGDPRNRGQIMADTLVERLTGQASAGDVPVEINLIMTDHTLFGDLAKAAAAAASAARTDGADDVLDADETADDLADDDLADDRGRAAGAAGGAGRDEPAQLVGYGPIPAEIARNLIFNPGDDTPRWIRRLFTRPSDGRLAAMDSQRRLFTGNQRRFVQLRDQQCRQPYCDAPIRHIDHIVPVERGGPTAVWNAQGYCAGCNHAKQAPGWHTHPGADGVIITVTPTGHRYESRAPDPPGTDPPKRARSPVEQRLIDILIAA